MNASLETLQTLSWEIAPRSEGLAAAGPETLPHGLHPPAGPAQERSCGARTLIAANAPSTRTRGLAVRILLSVVLLAALMASGWAGLRSGQTHGLALPAARQTIEVSYTPPEGARLPDPAQAPAPTVAATAEAVPIPAPVPAPPAFVIARASAHPGQGAARLFSRGNQLAAQRRWAEASALYAAAFAQDRRPDHAFNLAVSLEHLGRRDAALEHYRVALAPHTHGRAFDAAVARQRIRLLSQEKTP